MTESKVINDILYIKEDKNENVLKQFTVYYAFRIDFLSILWYNS